jgi:hypothetical protein
MRQKTASLITSSNKHNDISEKNNVPIIKVLVHDLIKSLEIWLFDFFKINFWIKKQLTSNSNLCFGKVSWAMISIKEWVSENGTKHDL